MLEVGLVLMGAKKVKVLFRGLSEIYLSCYNLFLQFLYYRRRNKLLNAVLSMLSCGAFDGSSNPYIESIVEPCISKNQKEIFAMRVWLERKSWNSLRQWRKVSMIWKQNLRTCVLEREKNNSFEITVIILRNIGNVNLSYSKRILKLQNFYQNILFFFTL